MELWSFTIQGLLQFHQLSPSPLEMLTGRKATFKPSSNSIQYRAQHGHLQDSKGIAEETAQ